MEPDGDKASSYRSAAAACLRLARETTDQNTQAALLAMAQKWVEMAGQEFGQRRFHDALSDFNEQQMLPGKALKAEG